MLRALFEAGLILCLCASLSSAAWAGDGPSLADFDEAFKKHFGDPGATCSDHSFLRRASLDTIGRIPTSEELLAFDKDKRPNKRELTVKALLKSSEAVRFQTLRLGERLLLKQSDPRVRQLFLGRLIRALEENMPYDQMVRRLLAFEGSVNDDPMGLFLLQYQGQAADTATAVARQFVGVSLDCARCHDHPFADWKQQQFHELAAVFSRIRVRRQPQQRFEIYESPIGGYRYKLHGQDKSMGFEPKTIEGQSLSAEVKRRRAFADWLISAKAPKAKALPYLARSLANRLFKEFFGASLVGTVSDMPRPIDDPALLTLLTRKVLACKYDLRQLRAFLTQSRAYQRQDELAKAVKDRRDPSLPRLIRPLSADQVAASLLVATGRHKPAKDEPYFMHRAMLRRVRVEMEELAKTGAPGSVFGSSVRQALRLNNGRMINGLVRAQSGRVLAELVGQHPKLEHCLTALCQRVLVRRPSVKELARWSVFVRSASSAKGRLERLEDLYWVLLVSTEFACQR